MNSGGYFSIERNENGFSLYCVKDMEDVMLASQRMPSIIIMI